MGSSKGVMLSGVALIIGLYTVGIKKADRASAELAETHVYSTQAENIARSGVRFALERLASTSWSPDYYTSPNYSVFGGSLNYIIDGNYTGQAKVTSRGTYNGKLVTVTAQVKQTSSYRNSSSWWAGSGYQWEISKIYVTVQ